MEGGPPGGNLLIEVKEVTPGGPWDKGTGDPCLTAPDSGGQGPQQLPFLPQTLKFWIKTVSSMFFFPNRGRLLLNRGET